MGRLGAANRGVVTWEGNTLTGGFGSAVMEALGPGVDVVRVGLPDAFVPQGESTRLLAHAAPTAQAAAPAARPPTPAPTRPT